jgi:hypothetical protein
MHDITIFHAKKFKKNTGEFHGWSAAKHMGFIQCMIEAAAGADAIGVTVGLDKKLLATRKKEHGFLPQTSAYAQAFKSVLDRLSADDEVGALIRKGGLSVVIESGNANDENIHAEFKRLQKLPTFDFLKSFSTVKKGSSRAAELADFMAHYSWLHAEQWPKYDRKERGYPEMDLLLRMMINGVRTIGNYVEDIAPLTSGNVPRGAAVLLDL